MKSSELASTIELSKVLYDDSRPGASDCIYVLNEPRLTYLHTRLNGKARGYDGVCSIDIGPEIQKIRWVDVGFLYKESSITAKSKVIFFFFLTKAITHKTL